MAQPCHILDWLHSTAATREPSLAEIREELQGVLGSARLRQSPRLGKLLRYICTSALMGEGEQISEYSIALDVLGKAENFKEGKDAIVRVEVHRLRKRLAEFYEDEGRSHRLRIVIPTGRYVAQFQPIESAGEAAPAEPAPLVEFSPAATASGIDARRAWKLDSKAWRIGAVAALVLLALSMLGLARGVISPRAAMLDAFWNPVLSSGNPILLCIGNFSGGHGDKAEGAATPMTLRDFHQAPSQMIHVADASALAAFASLIHARGRRYRIVSQTEANYSDLQRSPAVLIGLLNNDWTKRLMRQLRFSVEHPAQGQVLIRDREAPLRTNWFLDFNRPYIEVTRDYALIVRSTDPKTEQMVVLAGGMSVFGTMAAAEFLTNENELAKISRLSPRDWGKKNLEFVLSTDVIRGHAGPPVPVAAHWW